MSTDTDKPNITKVEKEPLMKELLEEAQSAVNDGWGYFDRCHTAHEVRHAIWEGQHGDGRKHDQEGGKRAFPWEGASDTRIRTVDMIINEQVDLLEAAFYKMQIQVTPTQAADASMVGKMGALLRWFLYTAMADDCDSEVPLLANYMLTFGSAVAMPSWHTPVAYEEKTVTLDDLRAMAMKMGGPEMVRQLAQMLTDESQLGRVVMMVQGLSSMLNASEAKKVIKDLVEKGSCTFPRPYVKESRPKISALATWHDVFWPYMTDRLQSARWIAQREQLSEAELRARVEDPIDPWDEDFVKEVLDHQGEFWCPEGVSLAYFYRDRELETVYGTDKRRDLFEVWHFYYKATRGNYPAVFKTVLHPQVKDDWGSHGILDYAHGEYPFVDFRRERHARTILSSRGIPEVTDSQQFEIKVQRDARIDRASMTTSPPIKVDSRRSKMRIAFGPGAQIPVTKMNDLEEMALAGEDGQSVEVERATKFDINEYHGRMGEGIAPGLVQSKQQSLVDRWMRRWKMVATQMMQLAQQYTPPVTIMRVVGQTPKPLLVSREEIQGKFDLMLTFDARFADVQQVFLLLESLEKYVFPIDNNAVVNRDVVIRYAMALINPSLADQAVRDSEDANSMEIADEMVQMAIAFSGQEPPMKPKGQNYGLRMQVIQNALQKNPEYQKLMDERPDFKAIVEARLKFLNQQVQQQKNKQIGVLGTAPALADKGGLGQMGG
jgi:hypothetical protein